MKRLSYIGLAFPKESPISLLMRTAFHNGFDSILQMAGRLKLDNIIRPIPLLLADGELCQLLIEEAPDQASNIRRAFYYQYHRDLSRATPVYLNEKSTYGFRIPFNFRYCPECLKKGYFLRYQDSHDQYSCKVHRIKYVERCPKCDTMYNWWEVSLLKCKCGQEYTLAPCQYVSAQSYYPIPSCFNVQSVIDYVETIHTYNPATPSFRSLSGLSSSEYFTLNPQVELALKSFISDEMHYYSNMPLSAFEAPWKTLKHPILSPMILDSINSNLSSLRNLCTHDNCCKNVELSLSELTSALKCRKQHTRALIGENVFSVRRDNRSGKLWYHSDNLCDVLKLQLGSSSPLNDQTACSSSQYKTIEESASLLKTTITNTRLLARSDFLEDSMSTRRTTLLSLDALNNFKQRYILATELALTYNISTSKVTRTLKRLNIKHINSNSIQIYSRDEDFSALEHIDQKKTKKTKKTIQKQANTTGVTYRAVARELEIPGRWLKKLVTSILPETSSPNKYRLTDIIPADLVERLNCWRARYISMGEASKILHIPVTDLQLILIQGGLIEPEFWGRHFFSKKSIPIIRKLFKTYITCRETAALLRVRPQQIHRMIDRGLLTVATTITLANGRFQRLLDRSAVMKAIKTK